MKRRAFLQTLGCGPALACLGQAGPASPNAIVYEDIAPRAGVGFRCNGSPTSQKYLLEAMVGGVAVLDFDGDGLLDLFFVNGAQLDDPMPPGKAPDKSDPRFWNRLYRNEGNGKFTDVTERAGVKGHSFGMGVAVADFDNDGRPDLYVTNFGRNILYRNNGDGTFSDVTDKAGVAGGGWSTGACFFDYDGDGWLDLFVSRYLDWDFSRNRHCGGYGPGQRAYCHPDLFPPATHLLFHNNRDGTFSDVSRESGIAAHPGAGLGVAFNDFNGDGRPDLVVANDNRPQQFFRNLGNGKFEEAALDLGLAYDENGHTFSGMGIDFEDYDGDGKPDVVISALANERYGLFQNAGKSFSFRTEPTGFGGITSTHSGWGLKFFDFDNDGRKDLFIAQGHVLDTVEQLFPGIKYLEPPVLIRNAGNRFVDVSAASGQPFALPCAGRGVAFGDLDNDGQIEIAVNVLNGPAKILKARNSNGNHWISVDLIGSSSNRDGLGAKVRVKGATTGVQHALVTSAGSYLSASAKRVHFGLGRDTVAALVEVTWPNGTVQRMEKIPADRLLLVREPARK